MDEKRYCERLMHFRESGIRFGTYFGRRWFVVKALCIIVMVLLLRTEDVVTWSFGFVVMVYLIGVIAVSLRTFFLVKKRWNLEVKFTDWNKVQECINIKE